MNRGYVREKNDKRYRSRLKKIDSCEKLGQENIQYLVGLHVFLVHFGVWECVGFRVRVGNRVRIRDWVRTRVSIWVRNRDMMSNTVKTRDMVIIRNVIGKGFVLVVGFRIKHRIWNKIKMKCVLLG